MFHASMLAYVGFLSIVWFKKKKKSSFLSLFQMKWPPVVLNYVLLEGNHHAVTNNHKHAGLTQREAITAII